MFVPLTENIWYLPYSRETDRPNLGYIKGDKHCVMVDSGTGPAHVALFLSSAGELELAVPDTVFLTHSHWDHTFGLAALGDAVSIAGENTGILLQAMKDLIDEVGYSRRSLDKAVEAGAVAEFSRPHILLEYPEDDSIRVRVPDIRFSGELRMDIGGETLFMKKITSGHTDDCYYLLCEKAGVLFLGDGNSEELVGTQWIDHADKLALQIAELEEIPFRICLTGHVPPFTKEELLDDLRGRLERAAR